MSPSQALLVAGAAVGVIACETLVVVGLLHQAACLSGSTAYAAFVCTSDAARPWYERSLAVAAVIAPLGAAIGWAQRRWVVAWLAAVTGLGLAAVTLVWGLRQVLVG